MNREYIEKLHTILADEDGNLPFIEHFDGEVRATFSDGSFADLYFYRGDWHFYSNMSESTWV